MIKQRCIILFAHIVMVHSLSYSMGNPYKQLIEKFQSRDIKPTIVQFFNRDGSDQFDILNHENIDINTRDNDSGDTLLHWLIIGRRKNLLDNFLNRMHPNPYIPNNDGVTPISLVNHSKESIRNRTAALGDKINQIQNDLSRFITAVDQSNRNVAQHKKDTIKNERQQRDRASIKKISNEIARLESNLGYYDQFDKYIRKMELIMFIKRWSLLPFACSVVAELEPLYQSMKLYWLRSQVKNIVTFAHNIQDQLLSINFDYFSTTKGSILISANFNIGKVLDYAPTTELSNELRLCIDEYDALADRIRSCILESYYYHPVSHFIDQEQTLIREFETSLERIKNLTHTWLEQATYLDQAVKFSSWITVSLVSLWYHLYAHPMKKWGLL